jgi:hypothetical protein
VPCRNAGEPSKLTRSRALGQRRTNGARHRHRLDPDPRRCHLKPPPDPTRRKTPPAWTARHRATGATRHTLTPQSAHPDSPNPAEPPDQAARKIEANARIVERENSDNPFLTPRRRL